MKKEEVPQQDSGLLGGETKGVYATNEDGKFEMAQTAGWEVESIVLQQALDEINRIAEDALDRVKKGDSSPLEFHMYAQRMDLPMLAQAVGRFQWQVKRHFKPKIFTKLKASDLELYADVMGISVATLKNIPKDIISNNAFFTEIDSNELSSDKLFTNE